MNKPLLCQSLLNFPFSFRKLVKFTGGRSRLYSIQASLALDHTEMSLYSSFGDGKLCIHDEIITGTYRKVNLIIHT